MRLALYASVAALSALPLYAPSDDGGAASSNDGGQSTESGASTDAGGAGEASLQGGAGADQLQPQPQPDPPAPKAARAKAPKAAYVVWVQPGHDSYAIGTLLRTDPDMADALRGVGRARPASDDEVKAAKDADREIPEFG